VCVERHVPATTQRAYACVYSCMYVYRPNNGGAKCAGATVRGLVCPAVVGGSSCESLDHQHYGDRVCTSFTKDIAEPDTQLDGTSYVREYIL
jgi:hypothetical protein